MTILDWSGGLQNGYNQAVIDQLGITLTSSMFTAEWVAVTDLDVYKKPIRVACNRYLFIMTCPFIPLKSFILLTLVLCTVAKPTVYVGSYNLNFKSLKFETKSYTWKTTSQTSAFDVTNNRFFTVPTGGMLKAELSLTTRSNHRKLKIAACITLKRTKQKTCQKISGIPGRRTVFISQLILQEVFGVQKNDQLEVAILRGKKYIYKVAEYNRLILYYL